MTTLEFIDVFFSYGRKTILEDISFSITGGELVGLMGPNGAGKSTILKLAAGIISPRSGKVMAGGGDVTSRRARERARFLAYLPQQLDSRVPFRVGELVRMGRYVSNESRGITVEEALQAVGLLGRENDRLAELSGGEQRRAYIAMTLVQGAKVLLLDEPMASLDIRYRFDLYRLLLHIVREKGVSVLMTLHDIGVGGILDRLILLKEGRIISQGVPGDVLRNETIRETYGLHESAGDYPEANRAFARTFAATPPQ